MLNHQNHKLIGILLIIFTLSLSGLPAAAQTQAAPATKYLAFQFFTGSPPPPDTKDSSGYPILPAPLTKAEIEQHVQNLVDQVGSTGDQAHKLAFIIGPLALDYTDAQLQQLIHDSFAIATELNIAVGFHIDDSMFWARRSDLWRDPKNVEWLDWNGTLNTGRRLDWSAQPSKIAPQMCINSAPIQQEVARVASQVIGTAIQQEVTKLAAEGRSELFAGAIVGWETQIGQDFDTGKYLGYCALTNRGFSSANPPPDADLEREKAVQTFISLWASGIEQAGVNPAKVYSHTAVTSQTAFKSMNAPGMSYIQVNHFAAPEVSFGMNFQPGFSTYPQVGLMKQLYANFQQHGNPAWASSEGSTVNPATLKVEITPEAYLASMFNHNAALVNIFGWGVGTLEANPFWQAAASADAIAAYRKFLGGQQLIDDSNG